MWIGGGVAVSGGCYVSGRVVVYVQVRRVRVRDSVVTVRIALKAYSCSQFRCAFPFEDDIGLQYSCNVYV